MRKVFGYAPDGDARIYNLEDGESLPVGWLPNPYPGFSRHERDTTPAEVEAPKPVHRKRGRKA